MASLPNPSQIEEFLIAQYVRADILRKEASSAQLIAVYRSAQVSYASVLFYLRTGKSFLAEIDAFKSFRQCLDQSLLL